MARDPRLDERDVGEAGQLPDRRVDPPRGRQALGVAEEVAREEAHLVERTHAAADRRPEALDQRARDARRAGPREAPRGLLEVEGEVACLVARDAREQLLEHRVAGEHRQALVAGERRQLVDRAPRHVDGDEVRPRAGDQRHGHRLDALDERRARAAATTVGCPAASRKRARARPWNVSS